MRNLLRRPAAAPEPAGVSSGIPATRLPFIYAAPAWMPPHERVLLYSLTVGLSPARVLEIGTYQAGSTMIMCAALDDVGAGRIVCVDPSPQIAPETWAAIQHRAMLVAGASPEALGSASAAAGGGFELALIDGDHVRDAVERDIDGTLPVLADDAHLLLHDANHPPVREAIEAALERHPLALTDAGLVARDFTVDDEGRRWGGLRLLRFRR